MQTCWTTLPNQRTNAKVNTRTKSNRDPDDALPESIALNEKKIAAIVALKKHSNEAYLDSRNYRRDFVLWLFYDALFSIPMR